MVKLSVKFTTVFIVRIRVGRVAFGLVEDVGSLVLLAHAVNDEHDEQNGAEQTHDGSPDHGCKQTLKTFFEIIRLNTDGSKRSSGREHQEQQQPHRHGYYTAAHSHRRQGERHSQMYWRLFSVCVIGHVATAQKGLGLLLLLHKEKNQKRKTEGGNPSVIELANGGNNWPDYSRDPSSPFCAARSSFLFLFPWEKTKTKTAHNKMG